MKLCFSWITTKKVIRKFKLFFIFICFTVCVFVFLFPLFPSSSGPSQKYENPIHSLCIIVPFRDRFEELLQFVPYMTEFLNRQHIKHHIYVVNQVDSYRFNRGSLINVGFKYSTKNASNCDYIAMHDVDLLPLNDNISYAYPGSNVFHVASPNLHPRYHYQTFIGGILIINKRQFKRVNGLSNRYWGWGMEDDELYLRLKEKKIQILRPGRLSTNITNSFKHIHGPKRKRDAIRCYNQGKVNLKRDRSTGLHNVNYDILNVHSLVIDDCDVTLLNVELYCDRVVAPWCICNMSFQVNL